jgi:peroxiredoxin
MVLAFSTKAQTDSLTSYQKVPYIPPFKIQLLDSSWYSKANLPAKKQVLILYFSPDCGHCQLETEEVISRMNDLRSLQIVMITSKPYQEMAEFADHYKINRFSTIKMGSDPQRFVTNFYNVKFTPFSALYDKKGKLIKAYEEGIDWKELISLIR